MPRFEPVVLPLLSGLLFTRLGCVMFDDYSEGDLCAHAVRDEQGRAIHYPEARICPPLEPAEDAGTR